MSVASLTSAFKAFQPYRQLSLRTLPLCSFSTSASRKADQPPSDRPDIGASSLFDSVRAETEEKSTVLADDKEYHWSSANFRTSPRKLNMLARQLRNLPVEEAIKQMEFSPKRTAKKILHNLAFAKKNAAEQKGMDDMVIAQAWVGKGKYMKRFRHHARGRFGVMHLKEAHIKFILKEAPTAAEASKAERRNIRGWKETRKVWTPLVEDKPIYNAKPFYNW